MFQPETTAMVKTSSHEYLHVLLLTVCVASSDSRVQQIIHIREWKLVIYILYVC